MLLKQLLFPKNTLTPNKKTKNDYIIISKKYRTIVQEMLTCISDFITKNKGTFVMPKPHIKANSMTNISSIGDWLGPVLVLDNGKTKVFYRAVKKESCLEFEKLWATGLLQALSYMKMIPDIHVSDYYSDDFPFLLEVGYLPLKMYWQWDLEEQRDMLIFTSVILLLARNLGCEITDPHYANVAFVCDKPIYFDIGSFRKINVLPNSPSSSLLVSGFYRLIFASFSNSVLRIREPGRINKYDSRDLSDTLFEYSFYRAHCLRYHFFHSSKYVYKIYKRIFNKRIIFPEDIVFLFGESERMSELFLYYLNKDVQKR